MAKHLAILLALVVTAPARAVDPGSIDRSLTREPDYQTRLPKYCLLVFGPEAKARVWLVLDGNDLYLDRDGTGDLSKPGNRVAGKRSGGWLEVQAGTVQSDSGRRDLRVRIRNFDAALGTCTGVIFILDGQRRQFVGFD